MVRYERPQRGNPHGLTIRQHLLPRKTIARFCGSDRLVHVQLLQEARDIRLAPGNTMFCAMRAWDQKAEEVIGKSIEDRYQAIAGRLCDESLNSLATDMHGHITEMYSLWRHRCLRARSPLADVPINCVAPERELSHDAQERLRRPVSCSLRLMELYPAACTPALACASPSTETGRLAAMQCVGALCGQEASSS